MYLFVRERGLGPWHYALANEVLPVCGCQCMSALRPSKQGDGLCRCPCHLTGKRLSFTLCMKLPVKHWDTSKSKLSRRGASVCQACHFAACAPKKRPSIYPIAPSVKSTLTRYAVVIEDKIVALAPEDTEYADLPQGWRVQGFLARVAVSCDLGDTLPPFDYEVVRFT